MAEKRTENLTIRMTLLEKEEWYEKAARSGLTVSQLGVKLGKLGPLIWHKPSDYAVMDFSTFWLSLE